jgi:hypothetical protein
LKLPRSYGKQVPSLASALSQSGKLPVAASPLPRPASTANQKNAAFVSQNCEYFGGTPDGMIKP